MKNPKNLSARRMAFLSVFLAAALILSYVESMIPVFLPVPGAKIGLANIVSLAVLELFSFPVALIIVIGRVLIAGFLFGSLSSILYALAGGVLSLCVMFILKKAFKNLSIIFVSIIGAVTHNLGQLIAAAVMMQSFRLALNYLPYLILLAIPAGLVIGLITKYLLPPIRKILDQ